MNKKLLRKHILLSVICTLFTWCSTPVFAQKLIHCLGQEELEFHKTKEGGPVYELNRQLISEFASFRKLKLKPKHLKQICQKFGNPSLRLIEKILIERRGLFETSSISPYDELLLKQLFQNAPRIFFSYVSTLQSETKTYDCLEKSIPELKKLSEQYLYLENEIAINRIFKRKPLSKIFNKLKDFETIKHSCWEEWKKDQDKKKKEASGS